MKKVLSLCCILLICFTYFFGYVSQSHSDELDDVNKQISNLTDELNKSVAATKPLESQLTNMQNQIAGIKSQIGGIQSDITLKKKNIDASYAKLSTQIEIMNHAMADLYVKNYYNSPLLVLLSAKSASDMTELVMYQKTAADQDKAIITNIVLSIEDLETQKKNLVAEQIRLTGFEQTLDTQSKKLDKLVADAKSYQQNLSGQIAELSQKQQQLLAAKLASLNIPTTAYTSQGGCSSDMNVDPGFSPRFALFTFGVPNRVGLNQYGAKGRAEAGQSYTDILNAYYANIQIQSMDTSKTVTVNGTNDYGQTFNNQSWSVEDYLKHIYEMPSAWPSEALKAQAIAARSYVMHAVANGQTTVAPNQSFQEVKQEENAQAWLDAVSATAGQVMTSGGTPITAWFSSTHGGYEFSSGDIGWNSTSWTKNAYDGTGSVNSFSDLQNNAYDKQSPWFYCDWGSRSQYNKTAWLKASELADLVNVVSLAKADGGTVQHLSQLDKPNPDGTDTWDESRVRQELKNRGVSAFSSISSASVSWDHGSGRVTSISFSGDAGSVSFDGSTFKSFFNLRAPANIQIVGPLYNVEQK